MRRASASREPAPAGAGIRPLAIERGPQMRRDRRRGGADERRGACVVERRIDAPSNDDRPNRRAAISHRRRRIQRIRPIRRRNHQAAVDRTHGEPRRQNPRRSRHRVSHDDRTAAHGALAFGRLASLLASFAPVASRALPKLPRRRTDLRPRLDRQPRLPLVRARLQSAAEYPSRRATTLPGGAAP